MQRFVATVDKAIEPPRIVFSVEKHEQQSLGVKLIVTLPGGSRFPLLMVTSEGKLIRCRLPTEANNYFWRDAVLHTIAIPGLTKHATITDADGSVHNEYADPSDKSP